MNLSQTDITYISIAIGYTIIIIAYNKYIQYFDISESNSLDIVKTVFNVFMYMGILLAWFFNFLLCNDNFNATSTALEPSPPA